MSADNAIAILRTRGNKGTGSYEYRLAEYGVSGEPFERTYHTSVSLMKAVDATAMRRVADIVFDLDRPPGQDVEKLLEELDSLPIAVVGDIHSPDGPGLLVVDGCVAISFHCAQDFAAMFAHSAVFADHESALEEARRMEDESYVEYGSECVFIDMTWDELLAQAEAVRQRRLHCLVRGPNAPEEGMINDWETRPDFKCLGNPGIEDKLVRWGWPTDVVAAVMERVDAQYWNAHRDAENLRLAREGDTTEMERYQAAKAKGCCQSHDEVVVVQSETGEVRVHLGFNFGH